MSFWAYMLQCRGGAFYTGHTDNLEQRIALHQSGQIPGFTADRRPVTLVWSENFPSRLEALEAERRIKGWSRAKKLALIRGDWGHISMLAKKKNHPSTSSGRTDFVPNPPLQTARPEFVEGSPLRGLQAKAPESEPNPNPKPVRPELVEGPLLFALTPHPDTPPQAKLALTVGVTPTPSGLTLRYTLTGDTRSVSLPPSATPERGHDLWLHTCFEAFLRAPDDEAYLECNFAPSRQWAMYRLTSYRQGLAEVHDLPDPQISVTQADDRFMLEATIHPNLSRGASLALTAVIEEKDGTKSYWSLRHPPGPPDFHHADCFAWALEAPQAA